MTKCEVCGRDEAGLEEIGYEPEFKEHQGILKCIKCVTEYEKETHEGQTEDTEAGNKGSSNTENTGNVRKESNDWKDELGFA